MFSTKFPKYRGQFGLTLTSTIAYYVRSPTRLHDGTHSYNMLHNSLRVALFVWTCCMEPCVLPAVCRIVARGRNPRVAGTFVYLKNFRPLKFFLCTEGLDKDPTWLAATASLDRMAAADSQHRLTWIRTKQW